MRACDVDGNGVRPIRFGRLPTVLAGIIGSNIAVQLATVEAAESGRREADLPSSVRPATSLQSPQICWFGTKRRRVP